MSKYPQNYRQQRDKPFNPPQIGNEGLGLPPTTISQPYTALQGDLHHAIPSGAVSSLPSEDTFEDTPAPAEATPLASLLRHIPHNGRDHLNSRHSSATQKLFVSESSFPLPNELFATVANPEVVIDCTSKQRRGSLKTRVNLPFMEKREAILAWDILQSPKFPISRLADIYGIKRPTMYGYIKMEDDLRKISQDRLTKYRTRCPHGEENNICTVYKMASRAIANLLSIQHYEFHSNSYDSYKDEFFRYFEIISEKFKRSELAGIPKRRLEGCVFENFGLAWLIGKYESNQKYS
ncbi:hypothetical protein BGX26_001496 [Mortierella sp. AD094]|nr:hypothetical protein BGX26_001496 [Mortierella sp. AD094]